MQLQLLESKTTSSSECKNTAMVMSFDAAGTKGMASIIFKRLHIFDDRTALKRI